MGLGGDGSIDRYDGGGVTALGPLRWKRQRRRRAKGPSGEEPFYSR
jgi:hypothetical protein